MKQLYLSRKLLLAAFFLLIFGGAATAHSDGTEALRFTENKGQWQTQIAYKADLQGGNLYLEKKGLTYSFYDVFKLNQLVHNRRDTSFVSDGIIKAHAFKVSFENANPNPEITAGAKFDEYHNYFLGADKSKWTSDVKRFGEVTWHNLYPGIDLKTYSSEGNFKYDFIVKPGSDPKKIQLKYDGLDKLYLENGELHLVTSVNHLIEKAPYTYQLIKGKKVTIASRFSLVKNVLQFDIFGKYDASKPLIIDPVLVFSTHSGSRAPVFGHTATYDLNGNTYAAGPCYEAGYPATTGAFQIQYKGQTPNQTYDNPDVAISKYAPDGKRLIYATYLGGTNADYPTSLIVNNRNELLILGNTFSQNFPTGANSFDRSYNGGGGDLFVTQFDSTGRVLIGSTFIGGSGSDGTAGPLMFYYGDDFRGDIQVDGNNNCYIASATHSTDFPVLRAYQSQNNGQQEAVVFKLNDNLSNLEWSTYYGTTGSDAAFSLTLQSQGASGADLVYVTGGTEGDLGNADSFQPTNAGGKGSFVAAFNQDFSASQTLILHAASNLGTASDDRGYFIQIGPDGDVYVLGGITGTYPVSQGLYNHPNGSVFIQKLSPDLKTGIWSTTLGYRAVNASSGRPKGTEGLSPTAFLVDDCGYIYLTGWGRTAGLPVTPNAIQPNPRRDDLYLAVLKPNAVGLEYATYMGGVSSGAGNIMLMDDEEHVDGGTSRFDKNGTVYQAVCTNAHSFPTTVGAVFPTNRVLNNAYDEAVFKFKFEVEPIRAFISASPNASGEAPFTVNFTNVVNASANMTLDWNFGDGNTSQQSNPANTFTQPGTYTVRLVAVDPILCGGRDTVYLTIRVYDNDSTDFVNYTICRGDSVQFGFSSIAPLTWSPPTGLSNANIPNPFASPEETTTYTANIQTSPTSKVKKQVRVNVLEPTIASFSAQPFCYPNRSEVQFTTPILATDVKWHFGDGDSSDVLNPRHSFMQPGTYNVSFSGKNINGCPFFTEQPVTVDVMFIPNIFTPNNDGINETFVINCLPVGFTTLEIYNRWGNKVFESGENQYLNDWDGKNLPDGVYYYYVRFADTNTAYKGWVEIVR